MRNVLWHLSLSEKIVFRSSCSILQNSRSSIKQEYLLPPSPNISVLSAYHSLSTLSLPKRVYTLFFCLKLSRLLNHSVRKYLKISKAHLLSPSACPAKFLSLPSLLYPYTKWLICPLILPYRLYVHLIGLHYISLLIVLMQEIQHAITYPLSALDFLREIE